MSHDRVTGKIDKFIDNRFLDWGIRDYLYRVFWNDYPLKRDIELAGYLSEISEIEQYINENHKPIDSSDNHTTDFSNLRKKLNQYSNKLSSSNTLTWNEIKKDVLNHFHSDLRIYQDLGDNNPENPKKGYFLNTKTGALRYYNGKAYIHLCTFDSRDMRSLKSLFPALFAKSSFGLDIFGQKNAPLKAEKFLKLASLVHSKNEHAQLHTEVDLSFIKLFTALKIFADLQIQVKHHADRRDANELVADVVSAIKTRIKNYKGNNPAREAIMNNISAYLDTGDGDLLAHAVKEYDSSWYNWMVSWFYSSEESKTLYAITGLQKNEFFRAGLDNLIENKRRAETLIAKEKEPKVTAPQKNHEPSELVYDSQKELEEVDSEVDQFWHNREVTKQAMQDTLKKITADIEQLASQNNEVTLPEIAFPGDLPQVSDTPEEKTVIEHLKDCIQSLEANIENDRSNRSFKADAVFLQKALHRILAHKYQSTLGAKRLSEEQRSLYDAIGERVTLELNNTKQPAPKQQEVLNSVKSVRAEINRLQELYNQIGKNLVSFQGKLDKIDQGTFANHIDEFMNGPLAKRQQELQEILFDLKDVQTDAFDVLDPKNANHKKVCEKAEKLQQYATSLTDELAATLTTRQDLASDSNIPERAYIPLKNAKDQKNEPIFAQIMSEIRGFTDSLSARESSKLAQFFSKSLEAAHPLHNKTLGMFTNSTRSGDDSFVDNSGYGSKSQKR